MMVNFLVHFLKLENFKCIFFCFLFWWPTHEQKWEFFFIYLGNDVYVCCWFCLYLCIFMLCICTHHEKFENTHICLFLCFLFRCIFVAVVLVVHMHWRLWWWCAQNANKYWCTIHTSTHKHTLNIWLCTWCNVGTQATPIFPVLLFSMLLVAFVIGWRSEMITKAE